MTVRIVTCSPRSENYPIIYYDILLSDEYNRSYVKKYPGSFKHFNVYVMLTF